MHAGRESREQPKVSHFYGNYVSFVLMKGVKIVRRDKGVVNHNTKYNIVCR